MCPHSDLLATRPKLQSKAGNQRAAPLNSVQVLSLPEMETKRFDRKWCKCCCQSGYSLAVNSLHRRKWLSMLRALPNVAPAGEWASNTDAARMLSSPVAADDDSSTLGKCWPVSKADHASANLDSPSRNEGALSFVLMRRRALEAGGGGQLKLGLMKKIKNFHLVPLIGSIGRASESQSMLDD